MEFEQKATELVTNKFHETNIVIHQISEGLVNTVFVCESESGKKVVKFLETKYLPGDLYFYGKAQNLDVRTPIIYDSGILDSTTSYYIMSFIPEGDKINDKPEDKFKLVAKALHKIHSVKLSGFGRLTTIDSNGPIFEFPTLYDWIDSVISGCEQSFGVFNKQHLIEAITFFKQNFKSHFVNTSSSCLIHGDVSPENVRFVENTVVLFDPAWFRAATPFYELARFDYKLIDNPQLEYQGKLLLKSYLSSSHLTDHEEVQLQFFRLFCTFITYQLYLHKGLGEDKIKTRFESNEKRLKKMLYL